MIVPLASRDHYKSHLAPILVSLQHSSERTGPDDVALVASYFDLCVARRKGFRRVVLAQHGIGQSYGGSPSSGRNPAYPGGEGNRDVGLFLVPNEHAAGRWRDAYPRAAVEVVGSPRLDGLPVREPGPTTVAVSFHWDARHSPEARSAFGDFRRILPALAQEFSVIGHGHPFRNDLPRLYRSMGIEYVPSFDDVLRRADVYVCDNSSSMYEFASTGRPIVVLNASAYRRDISHGLRFWDASFVGVNVDEPSELIPAVRRALDLLPGDVKLREHALSVVYAYRDGAGERAARAIEAWAA